MIGGCCGKQHNKRNKTKEKKRNTKEKKRNTKRGGKRSKSRKVRKGRKTQIGCGC